MIQNRSAYLAALQWHIEEDIADLWDENPIDRFAVPHNNQLAHNNSESSPSLSPPLSASPTSHGNPELSGTADMVAQATSLANGANTLDELKAAIAEFEGLAIKKTATNIVFADGNPDAEVMVIGEAPGTDEDREGKPFVGRSGQLLDKILASIGLNRVESDLQKAVYISNVVNWRPPGNRSLTQSEIDSSLPFIGRHIALAKPKLIVLCGGIAAKSLLRRVEGVSKLRKTWHSIDNIPVIVTYHPSYLLQTPAQKSAVWQDMLMLQEKLRTLHACE